MSQYSKQKPSKVSWIHSRGKSRLYVVRARFTNNEVVNLTPPKYSTKTLN